MNDDAIIDLKCKTENCGQKFNPENIQLAIHLYGVIFLIGSDEGFIGITCPKCLETHLYKKDIQSFLAIYALLTSRVSIQKEGLTEDGLQTVEDILSFASNLRYYSPFAINDDFFKTYKTSPISLESSSYFCDILSQHSYERVDNIEERVCSFVHDFCQENALKYLLPAGVTSTIYWYKKEDVPSLLNLEKEKGIRIFPRYHYFTDLYGKIDSLLNDNYYFGKTFDQNLADHKINTEDAIKKLKLFARENDLNETNLLIHSGIIEENENMEEIFEKEKFEFCLNQNKQQADKNVKFESEFLDMLLSDPSPLGVEHTQNLCDYLWCQQNPFHEKDLSEVFIDKLEKNKSELIAKKMLTDHSLMTSRVRENHTLENAQVYLKDNLIRFLSAYQNLVMSGRLSYASLWKLKEKFLEELFDATNIGLRKNKPFTFHYIEPDWHIRFNGKLKVIPGKEHLGFKQVHFLLCNKNELFTYFDLDLVDGINSALNSFDKKHEFEKLTERDVAKKMGKKTFDVDEMLDDKGNTSLKKKYQELKKDLSDAEKNDDLPLIAKARQEFDNFIEYYKDYFNPYSKTKRTFSDKKAKKVREKVGGNILRAIEKTEDYDSELYTHLAKSIYGLSNKFYKNAGLKKLSTEAFHVVYQPDPDISWHLD